MKRPSYKCKKYYPGGPIIGYVLNPQGSQWHDMWYWYMNNWFNPEDFPEFWELIKDPILITEDGVSYYDKMDKCIWVDMKNFRHGVQPFISESTKEQTLDGKYIFFSTEINALAWIEENKPQYSKKEVIEFGKRCFTGGKNNAYNCSIEELLRMHFKK